jgi:hypothetical protein
LTTTRSLRAGLLRDGQAGRRDLPRPLDAGRGGCGPGQDADILPDPPDRHPQRRWGVGGRGHNDPKAQTNVISGSAPY